MVNTDRTSRSDGDYQLKIAGMYDTRRVRARHFGTSYSAGIVDFWRLFSEPIDIWLYTLPIDSPTGVKELASKAVTFGFLYRTVEQIHANHICETSSTQRPWLQRGAGK